MDFLKSTGISTNNFIEHHGWHYKEPIEISCFNEIPEPIYYFNKQDKICFKIFKETGLVETNYYIGVDWIIENEKAVYVEPKLNKNSTNQTDYLKMLFDALEHPEVSNYTGELFEIKWDKPAVEITQQQDLLTPLLVVQFLRVVQSIVRKGLKKSYYKVENNLYGKVKGKVLVGQTIKQNILKNKNLNTYCSYDEFGLNGLENRLIKKALVFVQRYLPNIKNLNTEAYTTGVFNYINPAFEFVSDEVNLNDVKHTKTNSFYKEYEEAIKLAKQILKKFGYNITNTNPNEKIFTPPFWIDMSKLFELYVLGLLKDKHGSNIKYGEKEAKGEYGLPDYLLTEKGNEFILDAKYKLLYIDDNKYDIDNIRQLSGYSRDLGIIEKLGFDGNYDKMIPCIIIYPQKVGVLPNEKFELNIDKKVNIGTFKSFYKIGVPLPLLKSNSINK
jgi:5-methylcytosine-specific restriction enzyme subunit McrC